MWIEFFKRQTSRSDPSNSLFFFSFSTQIIFLVLSLSNKRIFISLVRCSHEMISNSGGRKDLHTTSNWMNVVTYRTPMQPSAYTAVRTSIFMIEYRTLERMKYSKITSAISSIFGKFTLAFVVAALKNGAEVSNKWSICHTFFNKPFQSLAKPICIWMNVRFSGIPVFIYTNYIHFNLFSSKMESWMCSNYPITSSLLCEFPTFEFCTS